MDQHEQQHGNPDDAEFYNNLPDLSNILGGNRPDTDLDALLERLPLCDTVELIDQLTEDVCHLNLDPDGPNLQRILMKLLEVPTLELVRFYSRMAATLSARIEIFNSGVVNSLLNRFVKMLKNKKDEMKTEKMLNIKFIGELCKFTIVSPDNAFTTFELLMENYAGDNPEVFGLLNETCGEFLLRSPEDETAERMKSLVAALEITKEEEDAKRAEREKKDRLKKEKETQRILNKEREARKRQEKLTREKERKEKEREEKEREKKEREEKEREELEERAREKEREDKRREEQKDMARKERARKKAEKKALKKAAKQSEAENDEIIADILKERLQLFEELAKLEEQEKELDRADRLTSEHQQLFERLKNYLSSPSAP